MAITENWYIVLDLEFDPHPVEDEALIETTIETKRKEWSSKANDFNKGAEYRKYLDYAKKGVILRDMIGPDNIRAELIKDACTQVFGPIDEKLKMLHKEEISADVIAKLAKKCKTSEEIVKKRAAELGIRVTAGASQDYQATYDKYYKKRPDGFDTYNDMADMLESFHTEDLYDFLYSGSNIKNAKTQPCSALQQRNKELKEKFNRKADGMSGTGKKLCGKCDTAFKDDASKKSYDEFLDYNKRKQVLDGVRDLYGIASDFSETNAEDAIGRLTELFKDRALATKVLRAFCQIEKIPYPLRDTTEHMKIQVCRCGAINDLSDGRTTCQHCGLPLQIKCPKCGTLNENTVNHCKCGFDLSGIDKAVSLCELAADAVDHLSFDAAEMHLADAERYWPGFEKTKEQRQRLSEMKERVGSVAKGMNEAYKAGRFYEAKRQYDDVRKLFPDFRDETLEEDVKNAIAEAEKHKRLAEAAKDEAVVVDECTKAFEACKDYPGVREIIASYPPQAPTDLKVAVDAKAQVNVLSWTPSATKGLLFYNVMRKEGAVPISVEDGTRVGRVSMCTITDNGIVAGKQYFYAVFAERAEIFSKGLSTKEPAVNLFEISGLNVAAGDASLQFTWNPIADNARVVVERESLGKKTTVECNSTSGLVDKDLINDQEYHYHFHLTYQRGMKKADPLGINLSGTPTRPPLPVEKLVVKPLDNGEFSIEWENPEANTIQFFSSPKKPEYFPGDLLPLATVQAEMTELMVQKKSDHSGTFHYDKDDVLYITAFVTKSGSAVMGATARASRGGAVKIKSVNIVNGKIMISTECPKDCTGFVVLYKDDDFATDISDSSAARKYISLKQYQYDSGLLIDSCESRNYYFSVFAEFRHDGEKDYSAGTDYLFSNVGKQVITYSVSTSKKLFGGGHVSLTFEGEERNMLLPAIEIMSAVNVAPMFKKSANLFYEIPEQEMKGAVTIEIPLTKDVAKNTYIKAFLKDESQQDRYQLKLKLKSDLKIS